MNVYEKLGIYEILNVLSYCKLNISGSNDINKRIFICTNQMPTKSIFRYQLGYTLCQKDIMLMKYVIKIFKGIEFNKIHRNTRILMTSNGEFKK